MSEFKKVPEVKIVHSFDELVSTPFSGNINALCWQRNLKGDFDEIAKKLAISEDIATLDTQDLLDLNLSSLGQLARETLIQDQDLLKEMDLSPSLDVISAYPIDKNTGPIPTDVYSFHVDSCPVQVDTYLCSYNVAGSEGLRNSEATRRVDEISTREKLLNVYGGQDDEGFVTFLREHFYDLHYLPSTPTVQPYSFGIGNLWRCATQWPNSSVLPCIHRAPPRATIKSPRLLLIS